MSAGTFANEAAIGKNFPMGRQMRRAGLGRSAGKKTTNWGFGTFTALRRKNVLADIEGGVFHTRRKGGEKNFAGGGIGHKGNSGGKRKNRRRFNLRKPSPMEKGNGRWTCGGGKTLEQAGSAPSLI